MSVVSVVRTDFLIENKLFEMRTIFTKIIFLRNRYAQRKLHSYSL